MVWLSKPIRPAERDGINVGTLARIRSSAQVDKLDSLTPADGSAHRESRQEQSAAVVNLVSIDSGLAIPTVARTQRRPVSGLVEGIDQMRLHRVQRVLFQFRPTGKVIVIPEQEDGAG